MSSRSDLLIRIESQHDDKGFKSAEASAKVLARELDKLEKSERGLAAMQMAAAREDEARSAKRLAALESVGRGMTMLGLAAAAGLGLAAKSASDWESAWAGVTKTVDGSADEMAALEKELRGLANTLPVTHEEIAAVAEAAGQLGVKRQDIASFTKTMVDLGTSTNLTSDEAASGLAKLGNVMGVLPAQADRAGAALVALGNDGASTEADILAMSLRIAGAGKTIGMTEAQVLGFASALSSVGIEAEAGGSAISRVMVDISQSVTDGGDKLALFAKVAGKSTSDFARMFQVDAAGAVTAFISGLGDMQRSGQDVFAVLDSLQLAEIRVRDTLLRSAQASGLLAHSVQLGTDAWSENLALVAEASKRYETAESRVAMARNQLNNAAIDVGAVVLPAMAGAAEKVGALASAFSELPAPMRSTVALLGALAIATTLAGGAAMVAVPKYQALQETLSQMGPRGQAAGRALSGVMGILGGPWGIALAAATIGLGAFATAQANARQAAKEFADTLDKQTGAITEATRKMAVEKFFENFAPEDFAAVSSRVQVSLSEIVDASLEGGDAVKRLDDKLAEFQANAWKTEGQDDLVGPLTALRSTLGGLDRDMNGARIRQAEMAKAMGDAGAQASGVSTQTSTYGRALGDVGGKAQQAADNIDKLIDAFQRQSSVLLGARDATRGYEAAIDAAEEAARTNGITLDVATEKGRANQEALDGIAESALKMAGETIRSRDANTTLATAVSQATTQVATARDEFTRMAVKMGMGKEEASKLADQLGLTKQGVNELSKAIDNVPKTPTVTFTINTAASLAKIAEVRARIADMQEQQNAGARGWATGGYTGDGNPDDIAGVVHKREFVLNEEAVARIGLANLYALNSGYALPPPSGAAPTSGPMAISTTVSLPSDGLELSGSISVDGVLVPLVDARIRQSTARVTQTAQAGRRQYA